MARSSGCSEPNGAGPSYACSCGGSLMNTVAEKPQTSRRRPRQTPKGRQVDPRALAEIQELLGARPRRRDLLIEFLHLIQDRFGYISAPHLAALADEMKLAQAEVYEVATFYAHFDVVKDGPPPPAVTVRVCRSEEHTSELQSPCNL